MPTARVSTNASSLPGDALDQAAARQHQRARARSGRSRLARRPWPGTPRVRAKRTAETTAPTMITVAPTPLPTAASTRGNAPNTSLPTGMAVPWTVSIGAREEHAGGEAAQEDEHPLARRPIRPGPAGAPCRAPATGRDSTAPRRKNTRKVPLSQPVDTPVASAADASAKSARAIVQARSWGSVARRSPTRTASPRGEEASPTTMGRGRTQGATRTTTPSSVRQPDPACEERARSRCTLGHRGPPASTAPAGEEGPIPDGRPIPEATVARLPLYYRALLEVAEQDVGTVSSERLAELAGVNAAKVRKDLSYLGSYGTRGVGYEVEFLSTGSPASSGSPTTGPSSSSGSATSARRSPTTAASARGASGSSALVDADPEKVGEPSATSPSSPSTSCPRSCAAAASRSASSPRPRPRRRRWPTASWPPASRRSSTSRRRS